MDDKYSYVIKPQKGLQLNLRELVQYKELFYFFTWRDIKVKYKQTFIGFLWAVLQPLLTMLIFTFFFGKLLNVPSDGIPYPVFAYSGLIIWNVFAGGMNSSANSMVVNANIIKKIYFPRLIIPLSSILVAAFDFFMAFVVFIGLVYYYDMQLTLSMLLFIPASLLLAIVSVFGMGSMFAAMNVKYRDFRYVVPFFIQAFMFLTPVIYPVSIIKYEWAKYIIALNPMSGAVNLMRHPLVGSELDSNLILISVVSAIVLFILGLFVFKKTEAYFADIV